MVALSDQGSHSHPEAKNTPRDYCKPFQGQLLSALEIHFEVLKFLDWPLVLKIKQTCSLEKDKEVPG